MMMIDKFENTVATLLEAEGYWLRRSFRVKLTPEEKRQIGKQASLRTEIDMLAFQPARNELLALEVKAYSDTPGVKLAQLQELHEVPTGRFKLFTSEPYRQIVLHRLKQELLEQGLINTQTQVSLGLIAGKISQGQSEAIREHMQARQWLFWSPEDVKTKAAARQQAGD